MEFKNNKPVYFQIVDHITENILLGTWELDSRIPSVRQFAKELEVNPNTVMRAYIYLKEKNILYNKRGVGFFISMNSRDKLLQIKKEYLISDELPEIFKSLEITGMSLVELAQRYHQYIKEKSLE
ncbi:MAG: GntR family transcriptional regulator [bacterium]